MLEREMFQQERWSLWSAATTADGSRRVRELEGILVSIITGETAPEIALSTTESDPAKAGP